MDDTWPTKHFQPFHFFLKISITLFPVRSENLINETLEHKNKTPPAAEKLKWELKMLEVFTKSDRATAMFEGKDLSSELRNLNIKQVLKWKD